MPAKGILQLCGIILNSDTIVKNENSVETKCSSFLIFDFSFFIF